jgi:hypothetical protein
LRSGWRCDRLHFDALRLLRIAARPDEKHGGSRADRHEKKPKHNQTEIHRSFSFVVPQTK